MRARHVILDLKEFVEDAFEVFMLNADAGVRDRDPDFAAADRRTDFDGAWRWCESNRIVEYIRERHFESRAICDNDRFGWKILHGDLVTRCARQRCDLGFQIRS